MARRKGFVRTGTLKKHAAQGLIERIDIVDDEGASVEVHYKAHARGEKKRVLTAYHVEGPKRFSSVDSAWKLVRALHLHEALIRDDNADDAST